MGEIADMMIDGSLDWFTGEWLGQGPGYPRTKVKGHCFQNTDKPHKCSCGKRFKKPEYINQHKKDKNCKKPLALHHEYL